MRILASQPLVLKAGGGYTGNYSSLSLVDRENDQSWSIGRTPAVGELLLTNLGTHCGHIDTQ